MKKENEVVSMAQKNTKAGQQDLKQSKPPENKEYVSNVNDI